MRLAPLNNSVVFKKLFQDPATLKAFVKDLIGIDIEPETIETEKRFSPPIGNINIAFDIFAEDSKHRLIVEIQRVHYDDHYDRFLHYFLAAILELAKSYKEYKLNRTVYTIIWLPKRVKEKKYQHSIITNTFHSVSETDEVVNIYNHTLYFLNPFYINDKTPAGVADWMQLVIESINNPQNPQLNYERGDIKRATTLIQDDDLTPDELAKLIDERAYERTLQSHRKEGRQEGRQEGLQEGLLKTAKGMRAKGFEVATIAEITGLSEEVIANLDDEI